MFVTRRRRVDEFRVSRLVNDIEVLHKKGVRVILIVSGAVAVGMHAFETTSQDTLTKRCAAGVGQLWVMNEFYRRFLQKNIFCAQILLTKKYEGSSSNRNLFKSTLQLYLDHSIIPIINENDVIDLYSFGGNDELALFIAKLIHASKLIMLSSFKSYFGFGGGKSKAKVLEKAQKAGISAIITDGKKPWINLIKNYNK